jgi:hypothetical protein
VPLFIDYFHPVAIRRPSLHRGKSNNRQKISMNFHITPKSKNDKTGPIPVTTSTARTCPSTCPLKNNGCYAAGGKLNLHWQAVTEHGRGHTWAGFIAHLSSVLSKQAPRALWRHNQAGDLPGVGNRINKRQALQLASVNATHAARGYTYTHKPVLESESAAHAAHNRDTIAEMNTAGLTVNVSANNLAHADALASLAIAPVVCVLDKSTTDRTTTTPAGRKVIICPAQLSDKVTCATCGLCAVNNPARPIVGFLAHGPSARKASAVACSNN